MKFSLYEILYRAIILGGALTSLLTFNRQTRPFRVLALFLCYTFLSETANLYMAITKNYNYVVFKIYLPVQIIAWGVIYYFLFQSRKVQLLAAILSLASLMLSVIYILSLPEKRMPTTMINAESLLLVFFAILYFYFLVKHPVEDNILSVPAFWLCSSILIYNCGSFIYMASFNFLYKSGVTLATLNNIHNGLNIFHYGVLWYAIHLQALKGKDATLQ